MYVKNLSNHGIYRANCVRLAVPVVCGSLSPSGNPLQPSTWWQAWRKVRAAAFTPEQLASPLMKHPYDLRHSGVTWQLNSGVPVLQSGFVTYRVGGHRSPQRSLTEGDGHLTIMVCEISEQRGGRRGR
jgi:hypothetical protein